MEERMQQLEKALQTVNMLTIAMARKAKKNGKPMTITLKEQAEAAGFAVDFTMDTERNIQVTIRER